MNYLIAVYANKVEALSARTALEKSLPSEQISILGEGFESTDEYGLIKPERQAKSNLQSFAYWVVPLGFACGYAFNFLENIEIPTVDGVLNQVAGGLLGAAFGLLFAFAVGSSVESNVVNKDASLYRDRLNAGKYLIVFHGTSELVKIATNTLHCFDVENI
ncbi:hypothetical protein [Calothrix sp. CCY 0018]|uniref:hypothetical protein n=1 Tax=Calothrix sp. CCY 0018 TaxID=3103864 RepID=UPI0039C75FFC